MRSDLVAFTAAVAGCAVAAPAANPQWQWGSWGGNGGGWGSNGGWGQAPPPSIPSGGSSAPGGSAPGPQVSPPVASPPFPTATGAGPIGTGVPPVGTGVAPTGVVPTGVVPTGTAPIRAASTGVSSEASNSSSSASGLTGKSTDANGINALFVSKGKEYYGSIADPGTLSSSETTDILKADFGQITPENRYVSTDALRVAPNLLIDPTA